MRQGFLCELTTASQTVPQSFVQGSGRVMGGGGGGSIKRKEVGVDCSACLSGTAAAECRL